MDKNLTIASTRAVVFFPFLPFFFPKNARRGTTQRPLESQSQALSRLEMTRNYSKKPKKPNIHAARLKACKKLRDAASTVRASNRLTRTLFEPHENSSLRGRGPPNSRPWRPAFNRGIDRCQTGPVNSRLNDRWNRNRKLFPD